METGEDVQVPPPAVLTEHDAVWLTPPDVKRAFAVPFPRYDPDVQGTSVWQNAALVPDPVQVNVPPTALRELAVTEVFTEACARAGAARRKRSENAIREMFLIYAS